MRRVRAHSPAYSPGTATKRGMRVVAESSGSRLDITRRHILGAAATGIVLPAQANTPELSLLASTRPSPAQPSPGRPLPRIPKVPLAPNLTVSKIIRGCWQLDGGHRGDPASDRTSGAEALQDFDVFMNAGITTFDTADIYGPAEVMLGQYLKLDPVAASEVQVASKLCLFGDDMSLSPNMLEYRVRAACQRLGLPSLNLLQLYWEDPANTHYVDVLRTLQDLKEEGLIQNIGVTNFDTRALIRVVDSGVKVLSNQVHFSVIDRRAELYMTQFCTKHKIHILPYGVLAGGLLDRKFLDLPAAQVRLDTPSKMQNGMVLKQLGGWAWMQDMLQVLNTAAEKHHVPLSAVAIRWVLQQPCVPAAIIGARNASHIKALRAVFSFDLDDLDMLDIDAAYEGATQPSTDCFVWENTGRW